MSHLSRCESARGLLGSERHGEPERRSVPGLAIDADVAAVRMDDLARDEQPEAGSAGRSARDGDVLVEDRLPVVRRDARAVIVDLEAEDVALGQAADRDGPAGGAVADRVADEVREHE